MIQNLYEMMVLFWVTFFGTYYVLTRRHIIHAHRQTTQILRMFHEQTTDILTTRPRVDFSSVIDEIKEDGKQTRLSIDKSAQRALEVIRAPLVNRGEST